MERVAPVDEDAGVYELTTNRFGYDLAGRLTTVTNAFGTTNEVVTSYGYDELGNQTTQTDAMGRVTSYTYDKLGRRVTRTLPQQQSETLSYDALGNLTNKVDFNGLTIHFHYDEMNRLTNKWSGTSITMPTWFVHYEYNDDGGRRRMTDNSGVTTWSYDALGRTTGKFWTPVGTSSTLSLTYTHKDDGQIESITSATPGGAQMIYGYDTLNRLKTVTDHQNDLTTYNYNAAGSLQSFKMPNNVWHTYQYDWLNRLTHMTVGNTRTYDYTVNLMGHRTSVTDDSARVVSYSYDKLFRLTQEAIASDPNNLNGSIDYTYDAVGNRKTRTATGNIANQIPNDTYNYTANDWLHDPNLSPNPLDLYDSNGNTTKGILPDGTVADDQYDFENRLVHRVHATLIETNTIDIVYDGDGNRVAKTVTPYGGTATTTYFLVDTQNPTGYAQVLEEHVSLNSQPSTLSRIYTYGHDLISMDQDDGGTWKTSFYGYDGHGNVRQLFDISGTIVTDTYDYDAFGNLIASTGATPNNYLYTGEQFDPHLGLYFLRARYNNVATGRFWTMDSYEGRQHTPATLHKYFYCHSDPVNLKDPTGNSPAAGALGAAGIAGGMMGGLSASIFSAKTFALVTIATAHFAIRDHDEYGNFVYRRLSPRQAIDNFFRLGIWADRPFGTPSTAADHIAGNVASGRSMWISTSRNFKVARSYGTEPGPNTTMPPPAWLITPIVRINLNKCIYYEDYSTPDKASLLGDPTAEFYAIRDKEVIILGWVPPHAVTAVYNNKRPIKFNPFY